MDDFLLDEALFMNLPVERLCWMSSLRFMFDWIISMIWSCFRL